MDVEFSKENTLPDELIGRISSLLDETASKTVHRDEGDDKHWKKK